MRVLLYQDYIHNNGVLHAALRGTFGAAEFCDAADIANGALWDADLFVMPGGADLYYCEKLDGAGNAAIRQWVRDGGRYLGICAGAYYACATITWAAGTAQEITGPRELGFFPGAATGPVYDFIEDGDIGKSWDGVAPLAVDGRTRHEFYAGGPVFGDAEKYDGVRVLARYATLPGAPAAAVACAVGRGRAVLCGPHPEYGLDSLGRTFYNHRNPSAAWRQKTAQRLAAAPQNGPPLWETITAELMKDESP
jgi:glutamine amidotransferase-like uncharacterized protein